jgi:hypothetical protein
MDDPRPHTLGDDNGVIGGTVVTDDDFAANTCGSETLLNLLNAIADALLFVKAGQHD